jgi:hypothetical protein
MYLAIISIGPGAANSAVTRTVQTVWNKYNRYIYFLTYQPGMLNFPPGFSISNPTVVWAEVSNSLEGKFKTIYIENGNFSQSHLDAITAKWLLQYDLPSSKEDGDPVAKNGKAGSTGTTNPTEKEDGNAETGNGGQYGLSKYGINLFNLNLNVPSWVWLIGAGFGTMKALDTPQRVGKIAYAGAAAFCAINYINKAKIPLPFKIPGVLGELPQISAHEEKK